MTTSIFRRRILLATMGSVGILLAPYTAAKALLFEGSDLTRARLKPLLSLTDTQGTERHLEDFKGKVLLVFFGYTQCPDICPTTMAQAAHVMELLQEQAANVQVIMITVDPERDTPEILDAYVKAFDPSFVGLQGTLAQLEKTAQSFNAIYTKEPGPDPANYTMNHTAAFYLLDQQGRPRALLGPALSAAQIVHDIQLLLQEPAPTKP